MRLGTGLTQFRHDPPAQCGDLQHWLIMRAICRVAGLWFAVGMSACAIPNHQLMSMLASQGVVSPSYVEHHRSRAVAVEGGWFVTSRDQLRQIAPNVCRTTERYFGVYESDDGYRIEPGAVAQMVALKTCASVRDRDDLATVSLPYRVSRVEPEVGEFDDATLLKFLDPVLALPKLAAGNNGDVRVHYAEDQEDDLRALLSRLDLSTLQWLSIYRTFDSMEAKFPIDPRRSLELLVTFTLDNGRVTDIDLSMVYFII